MRDNSFCSLVLLLALLPGASCREQESGPTGVQRPSADEAPAAAPCVHFEALRPFLPESLEGLTRARDEASTGRYGAVSMTEVERTFTREPGREVKVRIVDTTLVERLGRAIRATAEDGRGRPEGDPLAPIFWEDTVGFVRYDVEGDLAEASLLVGERYVVAVSSQGFTGTEQVRQVARGLDLKRLAGLR